VDAKLKHLELVQAAIGRMAQNSSLFKGWAVTIAAGLSAFGAANTKHGLLVIALTSSIVFWGLDGYYLWLERAFIRLYDVVAKTPEDAIDFSMRPLKLVSGSNRFTCWLSSAWEWLKACLRPHNLLFYGAIIVLEIVGIFVIKGSK
jgi:hypothetical protein